MKEQYSCVRCGYESQDRACMRRHFYKKKPCPSTKNDIQLTEDIKQHILENRVYQIPKKEDPQKTTQNIITYNNIMNNYINNMDPIEKLQKFLKHNQTYLIDFKDHLGDTLQCKVEELQNDDVQLSKDDMLDIVDYVSKAASKHMKEFNILYDEKGKKLKMYDDGEWTDYFVPKGVKLVIKAIQEYYLEHYECHLIRKIEHSRVSTRERQQYKDLLNDYYKFIASFDVDPIVLDKRDRDILYDKFTPEWTACSSSQNLSETYMTMYTMLKDTIQFKDVNAVRKHVIEILKLNTRHNIEKLNKNVAKLFNIDESFKENILKKGIAPSNNDEEEEWDLSSEPETN